MSATKRWESAGHIALGWLCELLPFRLLLDRREWRQLPPENDDFPVIYVQRIDGHVLTKLIATTTPIDIGTEYWSKARVMDTLRDIREYSIGGTIGWFFVLGAGIALGIWIAKEFLS